MELELVDFLKQNETYLPINVQSVLAKLHLAQNDKKKFYKYVYTVLHYTTVSLENESDASAILIVVDICTTCLSYTVDHYNDDHDIPDWGLEKITYQLVKQAEARVPRENIEDLFKKLESILTILLQLVKTKSKNNYDVMKYIYNKVRSIEVTSTCTCHNDDCLVVCLARCKLLSLLLHSADGNGISASVFTQYLINLVVFSSVKQSPCLCHSVSISNVVSMALDHVTCLPPAVTPVVNMISVFVKLQCVNGSENKQCSRNQPLDLLSVLQEFYDVSKETEQHLKDFNSEDSIQHCRVLSRLLHEVLKSLEKRKTDSTLNWSSILPLVKKLVLCKSFYNEQVPDHNVVMTSLFIFYHVIHSWMHRHRDMIPLVHEFVKETRPCIVTLDASKLDYCLQCIQSICIDAVNSKSKELIQPSIPLINLHYQISVEKSLGIKSLLSNRTTLCKMLQRTGRHREAMKGIAQFLSGNPLDEESLSSVMDQWVRCKSSLLHEAKTTAQKYSIESHTIIDALTSSGDKLKLKLLRTELKAVRAHSTNPPKFEYHILNKIIDHCDVMNVDCWVEQSLLCLLLHAWPNKFKNPKNVERLASSCASSEQWEAGIVGSFILFLSSWEDRLAEVWTEKSKFESKCSKTCHNIDWFPSVYPPAHRHLISIVERFKGDCDITAEMIDDVINVGRCTVELLQLAGETISSLTLLNKLNHQLTRITIADPDYCPQHNAQLVGIKCQISGILSEVGLGRDSMEYAVEAQHLVDDMEEHIKEEENDKLKKILGQMRIDSKSALVRAQVACGQTSEAKSLLSDVISDEFIDAEHRRTSHTSSLAAAKVESLVAELGSAGWPLEGVHVLEQVTSALKVVYILLEQTCPRLSNLRSFELPAMSSDPPRFGCRSLDAGVDLLRQLSLIHALFHLLHLVADLWLRCGELRHSILYILDGLMLGRSLLLHQRELQFQVLLAKHARIQRNLPKLSEELRISMDAVDYLATLYCKSGLETLETGARRKKIYSSSRIEDSAEMDAVNNSSIMEEEELEVISAPIQIPSIVTKHTDGTASPKLAPRRRMKKPQMKSTFPHPPNCSCTFCGNLIIFHLLSDLLLLSAEHTEDHEAPHEAIFTLQSGHSYLTKHAAVLNKALCTSLDLPSMPTLPTLTTKQMMVQNAVAEITFRSHDMKPPIELCRKNLDSCDNDYVSSHNTILRARINLLYGHLLLSSGGKSKFDGSSYLDKVIDTLGGVGKNEEHLGVVGKKEELGGVGRKENLGGVGKKEEQLLTEIQNLCISDKSPKASHKPSVAFKDAMTPPKRTKQPRQVSSSKTPQIKVPPTPQFKVAQTPQVKVAQTPQVKGAQTPQVKVTQTPRAKVTQTPRVKVPQTPVTKSTRKSHSSRKTTKSTSIFEIYDEEVPTVTLSARKENTKKWKIPVPDIPADKKSSKSVRRVFDSSSDESFNAGDKIIQEAPVKRVQPRRRAKTIMSVRRDARRKHREHEGEVYTDEEPEEERPTRRARNVRKKVHDESRDENDDVELVRERVMGESPIEPLTQHPVYDITLEDNANGSEQEAEFYLQEAFKLATYAGDFEVAKSSSKLLSWHHCHTRQHFAASACQVLSVGVTFRATAGAVSHARIRTMDRAKKKGNTAEPNDPRIREALVDMVDRTHPSHVISCMNDPETFINGVSDKLPPDWSVCVMSLVEKHKRFIFSLTRIRKGETPFHIQTDGIAAKHAIDDHIAWYEDNISGMKTTDRVLWWTQRRNSHKMLLNIINHMEEKVLSINRGALLGKLCNQRHQQQLDKSVDAIVDLLKSINEKSTIETKFIEVYLASWQTFNEAEKVSAACSFFDQENISNFHLEALVLAFEKASATLQKSSQKRGHVILVLDKGLQMLPWETTPTLQPHSVSRVPSVHLLLWQLQLRGIPSSDQRDLSNTSFVINPKGDLLNTATRFGDWFNSVQSWKGIVSRPPTQDEWLTSLSRNDVFIFCGHGAGGAYVQQEAIARRSARGVSFLIGCSSGRLTEPGITEPDGMVTWYMMSGCPSVMSCLWTVTDKDIDKHFATSLLTWARTGKNLTEIIRGCDKVCKHPLLNGAATVVYGLPVSCTNVPPNLTLKIPDIFKDLSPILS